MKTIIYRKSDLWVVGELSIFQTAEDEMVFNVIPNFGGTIEDYATVQTSENNFHLESINNTITVVKNLPENTIQPPTIEERISAIENVLLSL